MTEAFAQISSSPRGERSDETVFGKPLAEVMMEQRLRLLKGGYTPASWTYSPAVPFVVSACIAFLRAKGGLTMEGIFRVSGFHESITKLRQFFNQGVVTANLDDEELFPGCHEAAGLLKLFLRELPTPLLTFDLYPQLLEIADDDKDTEARVEDVNKLLEALPDDHCHLFRELLNLLHEISTHNKENCMGPHNLATVIGPALMWPAPAASVSQTESTLLQLQAINSVIKVVELMIAHSASLTSLDRPVRPMLEPLESAGSSSFARRSESEELLDAADKGLLQRLKRMSRSFHESPSKRRRPEDGCVEEWEKELDGEERSEIDFAFDPEEQARHSLLQALREKRFSLPVGQNVLEGVAKEIGEEKVVCAASPSLGPAGELSQMSPAVSSLHLDKENLDNVLVLTSPYRPSKNPSPHPKKFSRTSFTVVRVRTKKGRTTAGDAFADAPASPRPLGDRNVAE